MEPSVAPTDAAQASTGKPSKDWIIFAISIGVAVLLILVAMIRAIRKYKRNQVVQAPLLNN